MVESPYSFTRKLLEIKNVSNYSLMVEIQEALVEMREFNSRKRSKTLSLIVTFRPNCPKLQEQADKKQLKNLL